MKQYFDESVKEPTLFLADRVLYFKIWLDALFC